jgi:thiol:disulfide interchange protein
MAEAHANSSQPRSASLPTAPLAAGSLIAGYAVAVASGSRPLGGVVLAAGGLWCVREWTRRRDPRTAAILGGAGLLAFAGSHVLARSIGAWPAVLSVAAAMAAATWLLADARGQRRDALPVR